MNISIEIYLMKIEAEVAQGMHEFDIRLWFVSHFAISERSKTVSYLFVQITFSRSKIVLK